MRLIWKNNSRHIFLLHGTLILLCAIFPKLTGLEPLAALRSLFCGYPLKRVELKAGFLLMASILQCHNWLILSYMVKSESWLLPRYGSRKGYINAARHMLLLSNFIVVARVGRGFSSVRCTISAMKPCTLSFSLNCNAGFKVSIRTKKKFAASFCGHVARTRPPPLIVPNRNLNAAISG